MDYQEIVFCIGKMVQSEMAHTTNTRHYAKWCKLAENMCKENDIYIERLARVCRNAENKGVNVCKLDVLTCIKLVNACAWTPTREYTVYIDSTDVSFGGLRGVKESYTFGSLLVAKMFATQEAKAFNDWKTIHGVCVVDDSTDKVVFIR